MNLDESLLEILACPCDAHAPLVHEGDELLCTVCDRAFAIRDGIPVLLLDEARRRGEAAGESAGGAAPGQGTIAAGDTATD
jgi:uncharacterized protein YbaR (Trm112 family)